jgi:cell division protein FtsB
MAKNILESEIVQVQQDLEIARDNRVEIEHNVKLLRPNSLDPDMLEEQAKKILGYAGKNEKVIVNQNKDSEK